MTHDSLAFRLFATAAAWTLLALPIAGFILSTNFRQDALREHDARLTLLVDLVRADSIDHGGTEPGQPKDTGELLFDITHSGWYWQIKPIDGKPGRRMISASLATETFPLPSESGVPVDDNEYRWANLEGPLSQKLRVVETIRMFGEEGEARPYAIAVAGWMREPEGRITRFNNQLITSLAFVGLGLLAVTLFQVRFGLAPLEKVERDLARIRSGDATRLQGAVPTEIQTLQRELNALLKSNEDIVERARTQVGNLAHGLKTPLAVIVNEAHDDRSLLAAKVTEQAGIMREQIDHYLNRARMAARAGVIGRVTEVKSVADGITRALTRIYRDKQLAFAVECDEALRFQGERQDLEEMLGNLLDNASKWASGHVRLSAALAEPAETPAANGDARTSTRMIRILIEDDGPGLTAEQLAEPVRRGRRLDETKPGSGLGHSIVADLAHSYRGRFELARSELGGLRACLTLPSAP
jgi:signal transduction histidine kinase